MNARSVPLPRSTAYWSGVRAGAPFGVRSCSPFLPCRLLAHSGSTFGGSILRAAVAADRVLITVTGPDRTGVTADADRHPVAAGRDPARHRAGRRAGPAHAVPAGRRPGDARRAQGAAVRRQAAGHGARLQAGRANDGDGAAADRRRAAATSSPRSGRRWARAHLHAHRVDAGGGGRQHREDRRACRRTRWPRSRSTPCCRPGGDSDALKRTLLPVATSAGFDVSLQRESLLPALEAAGRHGHGLDADPHRGDRRAGARRRRRRRGLAHHRARHAGRDGLRRVAAPARRRCSRGWTSRCSTASPPNLPLTDGRRDAGPRAQAARLQHRRHQRRLLARRRGAEAPPGRRLRLLEQPRGRRAASSPAAWSGRSSTRSARPSCSRPSRRPRACCSIRSSPSATARTTR